MVKDLASQIKGEGFKSSYCRPMYLLPSLLGLSV
jgi:hypothetical protein